MKQVLNVGIGGRSFVIDEDAFDRLSAYLDAFRSRTGMGYQTKEVMDDLEMRIAEIFSESLSSRQEVVDISLVERVIAQLGMPDGSTPPGGTGSAGGANTGEYWHSSRESRPVRKLYRDKDHNVLGGVASGLACYFDVDVLVIRISRLRPGLLLRRGCAGHPHPLRLSLPLRLLRGLGVHHPLDSRPGRPHQRGEMPDARSPGHGREYAQILQFNKLGRNSHGHLHQRRERKNPDAPRRPRVLHTLHTPLLIRQKNQGLLTYRWEESPQGPPRKYYQITDKGRQALAEMDSAWQELVESIETIKNIQPCNR